jgi:hypothetical protein
MLNEVDAIVHVISLRVPNQFLLSKNVIEYMCGT